MLSLTATTQPREVLVQLSLLPVGVKFETDSTFKDGTDLKRIALGDDGNSYAMKRVIDHPTMPICEWVGYHFCRELMIATPEFTVLQYRDGEGPPAFGSKIASTSQIEEDPGSIAVSNYFHGHTVALSRTYALDAFLINPDRHARNFLMTKPPVGPATLQAFDFSRAWLRTGEPFGNEECMRDSRTQQWWKVFKRSQSCSVDQPTLDRIAAMGEAWLADVLSGCPIEWKTGFNEAAVLDFWAKRRNIRLQWAALWLT